MRSETIRDQSLWDRVSGLKENIYGLLRDREGGSVNRREVPTPIGTLSD